MNSFGEKLKNCIVKNGYTVYRISKISGVERTGLQRCLSGQRLLPEEAFYKIMKYLHLDYKEQMDLLNSYTIEQIGEHRYNQWEHVKHIVESLSQLFLLPAVSVTLEKEVRLINRLDPYTALRGRHTVTQTIQDLMEYGIYETDHPEIHLFLPADKEFLMNIYPNQPSNVRPVFNHLIQLTKNTDDPGNEDYNLKILEMLLPFGLSVDADYNIYFNYVDTVPVYFNSIIFPYYIILNESTVVLLGEELQSAVICQIPELVRYYRQIFLSYLEKAQKLITIYADTVTTLTHFLELGDLSYKQSFIEYQPCLFTFTDDEMIDTYVSPFTENREFFLQAAKERLIQLQSAVSYHSVFSHKGLEFFIETGIIAVIPSGIATPIGPGDRLTILKRLREAFKKEEHTLRIINPDKFKFPEFVAISVNANWGIDFFIYDNEKQCRYLHISEATLSNAFADFISEISNTALVYSKEKTLEILNNYIDELEKSLS